jgi:hypothetical protein
MNNPSPSIYRVGQKKEFLKKLVKINSVADLNKIHASCAEHTYVCVQKDLFSLVDLLHILNVGNRYFIYHSVTFLLETMLNRNLLS